VWITVVVNGEEGVAEGGVDIFGCGAMCVCVCVCAVWKFGARGCGKWVWMASRWGGGGGAFEEEWVWWRDGGLEESKIIAEVEARCRADGRAQCR